MKPGRELDALVAEKVMGWKPLAADAPARDAWTAPYEMSSAELRSMLETADGGPPAYSTDIAAAWEVVAAVRERTGLTFALFEGPTFWQAEFRHFDFWSDGVRDRSAFRISSPGGAPHAICLAALKAVGHAS